MLYGSLEQMVDQDLIDELQDPDDRPPGASAKRRYFRITKTGRQALASEADHMAAMARLARVKNVIAEEQPT